MIVLLLLLLLLLLVLSLLLLLTIIIVVIIIMGPSVQGEVPTLRMKVRSKRGPSGGRSEAKQGGPEPEGQVLDGEGAVYTLWGSTLHLQRCSRIKELSLGMGPRYLLLIRPCSG